jgi:hypothetical protein
LDGEGRDQEKAAACFGSWEFRSCAGQAFGAGVCDLDAKRRGGEDERQREVASGQVAVADGIRGEFPHFQCCGVRDVAAVRDAPGIELLECEETGQTGSFAVELSRWVNTRTVTGG